MRSGPSSAFKKRVLSSTGSKRGEVKQPKTAMATSVRFTSLCPIGPADPCALEPAPSVTDWIEITEGLRGLEPVESGSLLGSVHQIRGSYRGWNIYLYPNVRFYRNDPKSSGGNGYAGWPRTGTDELVTLRVNDEIYSARVEFV